MKKKPNGYVQAVKDFKKTTKGEIVATSTACCSDFVPYSFCKRKFELSHGQKYVKERIKKSMPSNLNKPEQTPRVLVDHEVGSGKSELAIQIVNDHLQKGLNAVVACPDSDNIFTWQREIFKDRGGGEPIYKLWNFHPKNLDDSDYSSSRVLKGIYRSQWEKFKPSRANSKLGMFYIDTHDFIFRSFCALNDFSDKWPGKSNPFAQSTLTVSDKNKTQRRKTLKDQIRAHTKNFLIVVDECHQCIDSTKQKDGNYKYVNSLALLGMLMFAHDTCKIVLMTATALHVTGVGGVGALVYTLYPRSRKSLMKIPAKFPDKQVEEKNDKIVLTKLNENEEDENYNENNEDDGQIDDVGGISNENFAKMFLNKQNLRGSPPVASSIIRSEPVPSKFSLKVFSEMIGEKIKNTTKNTNFLESTGNNGKMKGDKNNKYAVTFAELTVDCIDYFNSIYNKSGKLIVTDATHGVSGFISHWSTAKDASLYPKASLSTCSIPTNTTRKFDFDKPCVYPLEVPFAPIHNMMLQPRLRALTNIKKVHDIITKEDPNTNNGTLNQEQRLLGLLQGRQQTMILTLCQSDMSTSSANTNDSKFKCFSRSTKVFSPIAKANAVKTIVMDVMNHLDKVELKKPKKGSMTQEWVKRGSSISVIPTSLQSYKDIILNEAPEKPTVFKLTKLETPQQAQKLAKIRKQTIDAKKRELIQLEKNIAGTAEKLALGASKAVSKSRKSITTIGRKKKAPAKFQSVSRATLTKKTRTRLEKDYAKQLQMKNKTVSDIKKLEATPVTSFGITRESLNKKLNVKGQIEFYNKELENAKGKDQKHDLQKLYSEELVKTGISFLNRLDVIFKKSNNIRLIDAKIRQESRKKFVKIRNDLLKMETGITALSMAGLSATVSVNGKKAPELVGQPLSIYGTDEFNPVFFRRPGNLLPMFSLFSTANLMLANIIRSTSNQVNKSTSPDVKRQGSVRVTLPEDKSKGNVMVYVDSAARSEGNELCHSLINQASCIQLESGLHEDTSSVFAVTGVGKVIGKEITTPSSTSPLSSIRKIRHKKINGPIFEFNVGKLYDTKGKGIPNLEQWNNAMDSYIKDINNLIKDTFGPPGHLGVDKHVESLLNKDIDLKSIGISAYGYTTRKRKSFNYQHDKDTVAYHNPLMSLLYSVFQHISSEEAISHVESELSLSMGKLDWQQLNGNETYEVSVQKKIESTRNSINLIRQDLFKKIRSVRGHIDKKLKTPVFFRYYVSKQKSVTSGKMNFVHLLNKPSKSILDKIYNTPENNTGDLCNAVISEMTHGGSMFNTPYMVLYHKQQKRQPISNAQRKQIYGRNARNCSMYLKPQNMIKRIDLKTTNSSFFGDENVFIERSNSPSPVRQLSNNSPSLSKGNEESANTSPSVNSKSPSANGSKTSTVNETNNNKTNSNSPAVVMSTRTRKEVLTSNIAVRSPAKSPAKTIPKGVQTFGIKVGKANDTVPLRHFSTYMGYDAALFQCGGNCDLTQQLYTFASRVCNANTTGVLLGQSKVMAENVRELLHCDRDRRLNIYYSNSEVDKLKSHKGMKSTEQNLIFENMRTKAADANMFKNYIRGESATVAENNTIKEKGENTPQNTRSAKLMKYKFAVQLMRTGLYEHWLKTVENASGSSKDLTKKVIKDFTNKALDAKIPSSRIKSDLMKNAEYVTFKKSARKKMLAMDYGTFVTKSEVPDKQKLSLSTNSKEQIFHLLFAPRVRNSNADSVIKAGWVLEKDNKNRRTGVIRKSENEFFKMKDPSANPAIALQKHITMQKNTLNEKEQKFLHSREVEFFIRAEAVPQYIRQIPILVKENISNNAKKLLAGVKIVNIARKMKRVIKPKPAKPEKSVKPEKSGKPEKTEKPKKPKTKDELKTNEELLKPKFKVIVTPKSFKVLGFKTDKKLKENDYVYKCSKIFAEEIAKQKIGFQMEIIVDEDKIRCKSRVNGIKEISK